MVGTGGVNSMFVGNDFPELGTDLVTALTSLQMNDFTHIENVEEEEWEEGGVDISRVVRSQK